MEKINELTSENIVHQNIERLKEIFPTAFSEGKLVVEELQALVGEYIEQEKEFYQMTWAGKTQAKKEANKVSTATLRPNRADSKDWDTTGNIFIEGDNLEVLKLLQKAYCNQIKMIYIDPPYNTGKDFVYKDNYKDNLSNYLELTGQTDEEGKKLSTNTESDGRYHSNWLNMMYPRLKLARNLMTDDGVIFISIDDNEQANLRKICDEIFGEENSLTKAPTALIWQLSGSTAGHFAKSHEYILCYSKNKDKVPFFELSDYGDDKIIAHGALKKISKANPASKITFPADKISFEGTTKIFKGELGGSEKQFIEGEMIFENGKLKNDVTIVAGWAMRDQVLSWLNGEETYDSKGQKIIRFYFNNTGILWYEKERGTFHPKTILDKNIVGTKTGASEIINLLGGNFFENPKPLSLLKYLYSFTTQGDDLILDFFSGSGTTAHAVMALNAEDGGNRKCISVQLPEPTDEKSEAYKAGYKTIAEITKERIRRAGELIKQENKDKENIDNLDVGFRAFKLDSSNIRAWDTAVENLEDQLDMFEENNGDSIKSSRTEEDVLFEILLKYGLELTLPIQEKQVNNCTIYNIGFGSMYICLNDKINVEVAKAIAEWHKESADEKPSVIFKDAGFANDADKTNTVQTLRQAGIENVKSI